MNSRCRCGQCGMCEIARYDREMADTKGALRKIANMLEATTEALRREQREHRETLALLNAARGECRCMQAVVDSAESMMAWDWLSIVNGDGDDGAACDLRADAAKLDTSLENLRQIRRRGTL